MTMTKTRVQAAASFIGSILLLNLSLGGISRADNFKAKYGPQEAPFATPLWSSNDYFRNPKNKAPQFWSLISFYIPQFTGASCSVASVTMTLNAARTRLKQSSEDKVISEPMLLDRIKTSHWKERTTTRLGFDGKHGMELDLLGGVAEASFKAYGLEQVEVKTVHFNDASAETKKSLLKSLEEFEKNPDVYLIANFDQKAFTDDMMAGHVAPVGAFDSENQKVLILDPDREYFSPYWVSVDTFLGGMNTTDPLTSHKTHRGFISIKILPAK